MNAVRSAVKEHRKFLWLMAAFTAFRLAVAPTFGLGTDEAHYVLYAKNLALSYFDHPPLVGWTHALFFYTLGTNEFLARLPAILLFVLTSLLCYRLVLSVFGMRPALAATAALNGSLILGGLGLMLLPESLLLPIVFGLIFSMRRLEQKPTLANYLVLGLLLGLAGLAKYTAILVVPPFIVYGLLKKRWDLFFTPRLVAAACVSLVVILPVLLWNLQHDFISFRYQSGHVAGGSGVNYGTFLLSLAAQFAGYSPPLFILAFYGLGRSFKTRDDTVLLSSLVAASILLFFLYSSLFKTALPHWFAVFYAISIPLGTAFLAQGEGRARRRLLAFSLGFSILLTFLAYTEVAVKAFRFPDYGSPFRTVYGLPETVKRANEILREDPSDKKALAVTNWTDVSRTMYYNLPYDSQVVLADKLDERYTAWQPSDLTGYDLLFINNQSHRRDVSREMYCREVKKAGSMDILLRGGKVDSIEFVWCLSFGGVKR
jgi:4-amino-4-deoxy-L-arabinose transferase-like glycosyltransferase